VKTRPTLELVKDLRDGAQLLLSACGAHINRGAVARHMTDAAEILAEHERLKAENAELREERDAARDTWDETFQKWQAAEAKLAALTAQVRDYADQLANEATESDYPASTAEILVYIAKMFRALIDAEPKEEA
jgi:chromosome segregation ATPase